LICWKYRSSWGRIWFFALAYFTLTLAPVLGVMRMSFMYFSRVADHLQYLALLGIIPLAAAGMHYLLANRFKNFRQQNAFTPALSGAVIVLALTVLTWRQSTEYKDEETLWRCTIRRQPDTWIAYNRLGDLLFLQGKFQESADNYSK